MLKRIIFIFCFTGILFAFPAGGKMVFFNRITLQTAYSIINWPAEKIVSISISTP